MLFLSLSSLLAAAAEAEQSELGAWLGASPAGELGATPALAWGSEGGVVKLLWLDALGAPRARALAKAAAAASGGRCSTADAVAPLQAAARAGGAAGRTALLDEVQDVAEAAGEGALIVVPDLSPPPRVLPWWPPWSDATLALGLLRRDAPGLPASAYCARTKLREAAEALRERCGMVARVAIEAECGGLSAGVDGDRGVDGDWGAGALASSSAALEAHWDTLARASAWMRALGAPLTAVGAAECGVARLDGVAMPPLAAADAFVLSREALRAAAANVKSGAVPSFARQLTLRISLWDDRQAAGGAGGDASAAQQRASVLDRAPRRAGDSMTQRVSRAYGTAGYPLADGESSASMVEVELSEAGEGFVAGLLAAAGPLCGVAGPCGADVDAAYASWGVRTPGVAVAVRPAAGRIDGSDGVGAAGAGAADAAAAASVELRIGRGDCNLYALVAAALAAGADGVSRGLKLPPPFAKRPCRASAAQRAAAAAHALPATQTEAAQALERGGCESGQAVREALGAPLCAAMVAARAAAQ